MVTLSHRAVVPRLRCTRCTLINLRGIKLKHLEILRNDVNICLETLECVKGASLSEIGLLLRLLDVGHNVCLGLDLFGECTETFSVEAD